MEALVAEEAEMTQRVSKDQKDQLVRNILTELIQLQEYHTDKVQFYEERDVWPKAAEWQSRAEGLQDAINIVRRITGSTFLPTLKKRTEAGNE